MEFPTACIRFVVLGSIISALCPAPAIFAAAFPAGGPLKFGMHEIVLTGRRSAENPFDTRATVRFTPPSGPANAVTVSAFYDGADAWRARVYLSEPGGWTWTSADAGAGSALDGQTGTFVAADSALPGRLLVHPRNPHQWITENGRWFLNLSDTAYFLLCTHDGRGEPVSFEDFTAYVRDAVDRGITSFRCFLAHGPKPFADSPGAGRSQWFDLFADESLTRLRLDHLRETDRRLRWLLDRYPEVCVQLILFPLEGWRRDETFWHAMTPTQKERIMRHLIARYAAFPQLFWLIVNDAHYAPLREPIRLADAEGTGTALEFPHNIAFAREVGAYFQRHDPWQHPLSTGPARATRFFFEEESWATYLHLEDSYDLGAAALARYRTVAKPVFLGEDRYEQDRPDQDPDDMRYFQRRLFWSWLLSGGSANYGGRWWVVHPYAQTGSRPAEAPRRGRAPQVFTPPLTGLDSVRVLHDYFSARHIELSDFEPDATLARDVAGRTGAQAPKLMRRGHDEFILYHPNARSAGKNSRVEAGVTAALSLDLSRCPDRFSVEWFRPGDGIVHDGGVIVGGTTVTLTAPWPGHDAVVRLVGSNAGNRLLR